MFRTTWIIKLERRTPHSGYGTILVYGYGYGDRDRDRDRDGTMGKVGQKDASGTTTTILHRNYTIEEHGI